MENIIIRLKPNNSVICPRSRTGAAALSSHPRFVAVISRSSAPQLYHVAPWPKRCGPCLPSPNLISKARRRNRLSRLSSSLWENPHK